MINYLIKEYVAITKHLIETGHASKKGNVIATKDEIQNLMNKNNYMPAAEKLKAWKALCWIETESNRVTKRIHFKELDKYVPCVLIRISVYETLKKYMK